MEDKVFSWGEATLYAALSTSGLDGSAGLHHAAEISKEAKIAHESLVARHHWLQGRMAVVTPPPAPPHDPHRALDLALHHFDRCLDALNAGHQLQQGSDADAGAPSTWAIQLASLRHDGDLSPTAVLAAQHRLRVRSLVLRCDAGEVDAQNVDAFIAEVAPHVLWPQTQREAADRGAFMALYRACGMCPDSRLVVTAQLACCVQLLTGPLGPQGPDGAAVSWRSADNGAQATAHALRDAGAALQRCHRWTSQQLGSEAADSDKAASMPNLHDLALDLGAAMVQHLSERTAVLRAVHRKAGQGSAVTPLSSDHSAAVRHVECVAEAAEALVCLQLVLANHMTPPRPSVDAEVGLHEALYALCAQAKGCCGYGAHAAFVSACMERMLAVKTRLGHAMGGGVDAQPGAIVSSQGNDGMDADDDDDDESDEENEDTALERRLDVLLAKCVFCTYGVSLGHVPAGHAQVRGASETTVGKVLATQERCAGLWRLLGPYGNVLADRAVGLTGGGRAGRRLLDLRSVLDAVWAQFPTLPRRVLDVHSVDAFLDAPPSATPSEERVCMRALLARGNVASMMPGRGAVGEQHTAPAESDVRLEGAFAEVRASLYGLCAAAYGLYAGSRATREAQDWEQLRSVLLAGLEEFKEPPWVSSQAPPLPPPPTTENAALAAPQPEAPAPDAPPDAPPAAPLPVSAVAAPPAPGAPHRDLSVWARAQRTRIALLRMHLCYQPKSVRAWRDLADAYSALLTVCLSDAAIRWGHARWTADRALDAAVAQYRVLIRRCLDAALACSGTAGSSEGVMVVQLQMQSVGAAYDALRVTPPSHDNWRSKPPSRESESWRAAAAACEGRLAGVLGSDEWLFPLLAGRLAFKQGHSASEVLHLLTRAVRLGPTVLEARYALHAIRLKLAMQALARMQAQPLESQNTAMVLASSSSDVGDLRKALVGLANNELGSLKELLAAAEWCHKARRRVALGHLAMLAPGVSPVAACHAAVDTLMPLFRRNSRSASFGFEWNIWAASDAQWNFARKAGGGGRGRGGRGGGRGRPSTDSAAGGGPAESLPMRFTTVGQPESGHKFMAVTRRCLLLLLPLLEATRDVSTIQAAVEHMKQDPRFGDSLADIAVAAQGVFVRTLLAELRTLPSGVVDATSGAWSSSSSAASAASYVPLGPLFKLPLPPVPILANPPAVASIIPLGPQLHLPQNVWRILKNELSLKDVAVLASLCKALRDALAWHLAVARRHRACELAYELHESISLGDVSWEDAVRAPLDAAAQLPWHLLAPAVHPAPAFPPSSEYSMVALRALAHEYVAVAAAHGDWDGLEERCRDLRRRLEVKSNAYTTAAVRQASTALRDAWHLAATGQACALSIALQTRPPSTRKKGKDGGGLPPNLIKAVLFWHKEVMREDDSAVPLNHVAALMWHTFMAEAPYRGGGPTPGTQELQRTTLPEVLAFLEDRRRRTSTAVDKPGAAAASRPAPKARPASTRPTRGSGAHDVDASMQAAPLALLDAPTLGEAPGGAFAAPLPREGAETESSDSE